MPKTAVVWLRNDLRLSDNPALHHAVQNADIVVPVYIYAPQEFAAWAPGAASRWWLHHSIGALSEQLRQLGSQLILRHGSTLDNLQQIIAATGATSVFWNESYEPHSRQLQQNVSQALAKMHVASFDGNLLTRPETIMNRKGEPYKVFTPFWNTLQNADIKAPLPPPRSLPSSQFQVSSVNLDELQLLPKVKWDTGLHEMWTPGERNAQKRFRNFISTALDNYVEGRDRPGIASVSQLSPHLHFGEISVRQIWHELAGVRGAQPFLRQIAWREFARHLLYHFPHTAEAPLRNEFKKFPWIENYDLLRKWQDGQTGYPIVDAGMRQLWITGWMHNRVRMIVGSFLVKDLLISWQHGADWFWDTLVDADLGNNTLGWQWIAGCGADAAPYFRIFNPILQGEKFDPQGNYVRQWIPELSRLDNKWLHRPWMAPATELAAAKIEIGKDYPLPLVDHHSARARALAALATIKG
jgi:deoxyribodipyrimidine photo-lyase